MRRLLAWVGAAYLVYGAVVSWRAYGLLCEMFAEDPYGYPGGR